MQKNKKIVCSHIIKVMFSSPGDVVEERRIFPDILEKWNKANSHLYNCAFKAVLWETDSIPMYGDEPQKIINEQLCNASDFMICTFWTKLGTSTSNYRSGTEEEMEVFRNQNKKVFPLISDIPVKPSKIDSDQFVKLYSFKHEKFKEGLFGVYNTIEEFKEKIDKCLCSVISDFNNGQQSLVMNTQSNPVHKPNLSILFNDKTQLELLNALVTDFEDKINTFRQEAKDIINSLPLPQNVDSKDVNEFIGKIKTEAQLEEYIDNWRKYLFFKSAQKVRLSLVNSGNISAEDIHVKIKFPKDIFIFSKLEIENMSNFIPMQTPQEKARCRDQCGNAFPVFKRQTNINAQYLFSKSLKNRIQYGANLKNKVRKLTVHANKNLVVLDKKRLLNGSKVNFMDFFVAPKSCFSGTIDVDFWCNEFDEVQKTVCNIISDECFIGGGK